MSIINIAGHEIGPDHPVFIVAELSGNHHKSYREAVALISAAKEAGADAVKLQTINMDPDGGITLDCDNEHFMVKDGPWKGRKLYDLYSETAMPWAWQPGLKDYAESLGLVLFSTPFDFKAVDFLDEIGVPCFKIASFEVNDLPLIQYTARKGKPLIISTGMADEEEIADAIEWAVAGWKQQNYLKENQIKLPAVSIILLHCTSAYPTPVADANLQVIPELIDRFRFGEQYTGLSDHTLNIAVPVAAVALGACVIEKHITLSRAAGGPDAPFSLEPHEFKAMVQAVRDCEAALGEVTFGPSPSEESNLPFRRSLFAVQDIKKGETLTPENVRSIRPAAGLHPRHYWDILSRAAKIDIKRGTPLSWDLITG